MRVRIISIILCVNTRKYFAAVLDQYTSIHNYIILWDDYKRIYLCTDTFDSMPYRRAFSQPLE